MKKEEQVIAVLSLLPSIADMLEDCNFQKQIKLEANRLINNIRHLDWLIMQGADAEAVEEQVNIQRAFRQWLENTKK